MKNKIRRRELYEYIKKQKEIQVADIADMMKVSCMTIRRDLASMEHEGLITRSYGRARLKNDSANETSFADRLSMNFDYKFQACKEAVKQLDGVSSIYLDGSTTCYALSQLMPTNRSLKVITSSLSAAVHLRDMNNVQVILPGGCLATDKNTINTDCTQLIPEDAFIERAFFSCGGFSENGVVDSNLSGSYIRNYILKAAEGIVLIADHTKYQKHGLYALWNWTDFDCFVTDIKPGPSMLEQLKKNGIKVYWSHE